MGDEYRTTTVRGNIHKFVLAERNRHRMFSLSDRSSRAIPTKRLIDEILGGTGLAMPVEFRRNIPGMAGGEPFTGEELLLAQQRFEDDARAACVGARTAMEANEAKETVNRRLDPYSWTYTVMTATRDCWLNFAGLRLDKFAQPEIRVFAESFWRAWNESTPKLLKPGQWHTPFVDGEDWISIEEMASRPGEGYMPEHDTLNKAIKLSVGRCAHTSYVDFETGNRMTVEKAIGLYDKLITFRPLHASPSEHQCTPDELANPIITYRAEPMWMHPKLHGNLPGWIQHRKQLPGERVAPLPEGYVYRAH
jgi:thymidylate synthase ThyX